MRIPFHPFKAILVISFFLMSLQSPRGYAQEIIELQKDFGQQSSALDPIDFPRLLKTEDGFITLAKAKGRAGGKATYYVQEWSSDLYLKYQHEHEVGKDVEPIGFHLDEGQSTYGIVLHNWNLRQKTSTVTQLKAERKLGAEAEETTLAEYDVATWRNAPGKGQVAARLEGVARGGLPYEPPLGYQVWLRYSPDRSYFLLYHYEFGKPGLLVNVDLFDHNGNNVARGQLPVNRGRISYDLYLNNRGEVLFLETTPNGGVSMVRYDLRSRESVFLEIPSSNYLRTQFHVHLLSDDEVYIANEAERDGVLEGVMFAHFNFAAHEVQDITFWKLSAGFKHRYDTAVANQRDQEADWMHVDLVDFRIDEDGRRWLTLEKRNYTSPGFTYDHRAILEPELWFTRQGSVRIGDAFVLAFDKQNEYLGGNVLLKSTSSSAENGFRTVGVEVATEDGKILVIHHNEILDGAGGSETVLSEWHPGVFNWEHQDLDTGGMFHRIRDYTTFTEEGVLMVGFTNALGRESTLVHFSR